MHIDQYLYTTYIYLPIYLSIYLPTYLSMYLSIYLSTLQSTMHIPQSVRTKALNRSRQDTTADAESFSQKAILTPEYVGSCHHRR